MLRAMAPRLFTLATLCLLPASNGDSHSPVHGNGSGEHGHDMHGFPGHERHGLDEDHTRPPICSPEDTHKALAASTEFVTCTGLEYSDFLAIVQADVGLLQGSALCFAAKADELEHEEPDADGKIEVDMDEVYKKCLSNVANVDGLAQSTVTADFLTKLLEKDSKVCPCLDPYVEAVPHCDRWQRFHHFGQRLGEICETLVNAHGPFIDTGPGEGQASAIVEDEEGNAGAEGEAGKGKGPALEEEEVKEEVPENEAASAKEHEDERKDAKGEKDEGKAGVVEPRHEAERPPHLPDPRPPCAPGEVPHGSDASKCVPEGQRSEEYEYYGEPRDGRGPPPQEGDGLSFGAAVVGVMVVGGLVGIGGSWIWSKFQSGTRQPGVRYVAAGVENDIGTELGPFGRDYA